jgi:hypothetical protein
MQRLTIDLQDVVKDSTPRSKSTTVPLIRHSGSSCSIIDLTMAGWHEKGER